MKEFIKVFVAVFLIIASCKPSADITQIPAYEKLMGIDLRPYAEKGFLFTPSSYGENYTTIALINFKIMPEANLVSKSEWDYLSNDMVTIYTRWQSDTVNATLAIEQIYQYCVDMGADALVEFKIEEATDDWEGIQNPVTIHGIRITGLAIRRED